MNKIPIVLALVLYSLIYFLRLQQVPEKFQPESPGLFLNFRESLDKRISSLLPSPQAELLSGILLGNKKDLPVDLKLALRDTSTLHIVVVSGQNLTFVAGIFMFTLAGVLQRRTAILVSLAAILFYTLLTGAQVPVIRAAIMGSLGFGAQFFGKVSDGIWFLILAAGLMLLFNPHWLTDLSFQLSFLATLGVIVVAPILERRLNFLPRLISQGLAITTGAQLLVTPVITQNFHQLSLVGLFANLMVGWTVPIIMILGTLMLVLGQLISFAALAFLTYFVYIVQFFASLPFAWEYVGEKIWIFWLGYYFILAGVLLLLTYAEKEDRERFKTGS